LVQSESEQKAFMNEYFAYHDELRKNGHIVGGEALQIARNAVTLRRIIATDFAYFWCGTGKPPKCGAH
jgi:hypothetical protein